jgi:hypothetical protein
MIPTRQKTCSMASLASVELCAVPTKTFAGRSARATHSRLPLVEARAFEVTQLF